MGAGGRAATTNRTETTAAEIRKVVTASTGDATVRSLRRPYYLQGLPLAVTPNTASIWFQLESADVAVESSLLRVK